MVKILIVEDEPDLLEIATFMFEDAGFEVFQAEYGQRGLELARTESPDVILLDNRLVPNDPDVERIDGPEIARTLRAEGNTAVLVAMTAMAMPAQKKDFQDAGCDLFMSKPVEDYDSLIEQIRALLRDKGVSDV